MILLIDNYDSFAHNLARYFRQLGQTVSVVRNDKLDVPAIANIQPDAIVMSPGPCTPNEAGVCLEAVEAFASSIPMLGICLGHQAICKSFGGMISRNTPRHGQASQIFHNGHELFDGIETPFVAGRYHSLVLKAGTLPDQLHAIAETEDGITMAVAHKSLPVLGVQFHPESILTPCGYRLLANFLNMTGIHIADERIDELTANLLDQSKQQPNIPASSRQTITPHPW